MFSLWSSHRVTPIRTLRTQPTLVAEQVTAHFVNPRLAARAHRAAAEDVCLFQAATGEKIYLRPRDQFLFVCLWRHGILCSFISIILA